MARSSRSSAARRTIAGLIVVCGLVAWHVPMAAQSSASSPRLLGAMPIIPIDPSSKRGEVSLQFVNDGKTDRVLTLSVGHFVNRTTGRILNTQTLFFDGAEGAGTPVFEQLLKPEERRLVRIQVTNLWEAGESVAALGINGTDRDLIAVQDDVPFAIGLQVPTPDSPELTFARGRPGLLVFKNDDAMTYAIDWRLFIANEAEVVEGHDLVPPKSTVPVAITVPEPWFTRWFGGLIKDARRDGLLTVRFAPTGDTATSGSPVKTIPVGLRLKYWSDTAQQVAGGFIALVALALGGVCSLFLSLWIPNKLLQISLGRRLEGIAGKIGTISSQADSALRVAVRVERLRLAESLQALGMVSADVPDTLKALDRSVDGLGRRIELVRELDQVARQLELLRAATSGAPPTLLDETAEDLDKAAALLGQAELPEALFQDAQTSIRQAGARLDSISSEAAEFAETLARRVTELRADFDPENGDTGRRAKCKALRPMLVDLFEVLKTGKYEHSANIKSGIYHWIDISTEKLFVLRHYIIRFEDTESDEQRHARIFAHEVALLGYLKLQNWQALDMARRLRREIEEDLFGEDVRNALLTPGGVVIERDPLTVHPNEPVVLRARFQRSVLDTATARREFACIWNFGPAVGEEQGWEITHYFRNPQEATFDVHFKGPDGAPVKAAGSELLKTTVPLQAPQRAGFGDQAKVEALRLAVALAVAVVGLMAGAREQFMRLDVFPGLIAVFLVGFGADAIKNLLTRRTP